MTDKSTDDEDLNPLDGDDQDKELADKGSLSAEHKSLLEKMVADELAKMKENTNKSYAKLAEIQKENAKLKAEAKELERKRLAEEGKHLEIANAKLSEIEAENKVLNDRLTSLTRDRELERHLAPLDFKSDRARTSAFKDIIGELVQDDDGSWVHKSGASITDYIKLFAKDPINQDFYFKPKENSGAGHSNSKGTGTTSRPKELKGLSTEELLALAGSGKLGSNFSF